MSSALVGGLVSTLYDTDMVSERAFILGGWSSTMGRLPDGPLEPLAMHPMGHRPRLHGSRELCMTLT